MKKNIFLIGVTIIIFLCMFFFYLFYPISIIQESKTGDLAETGPITETDFVTFSFNPQYSSINKFGLMFHREGETLLENGWIQFELLDEFGEAVYIVKKNMSEIAWGKFYEFDINIKLEPEQIYLVKISSGEYGDHPVTMCIGGTKIGPDGNLSIEYNNSQIVGFVPELKITYAGNGLYRSYLPYFVVMLLSGICILFSFSNFTEKNHEIRK